MMKSMGGLSRHDRVVNQPISIAYSGPSAGVVGMAALADRIGETKVLTYDMGGTSTDVALVEDGRPVLTTKARLDIYQCELQPSILFRVGAGGGSVATLGTGNRLRVGPESAGSVPGYLPRMDEEASSRRSRMPTSCSEESQLHCWTEASNSMSQHRTQPSRGADGLGLTLEEAALRHLGVGCLHDGGCRSWSRWLRGRDRATTHFLCVRWGGSSSCRATC